MYIVTTVGGKKLCAGDKKKCSDYSWKLETPHIMWALKNGQAIRQPGY